MRHFHNPLSSCQLKFAGDSKGLFEGYLSMFDNVDSYGDVVRKGAFVDTLSEWEGKGRLPPMLLNHDPFGELPIGVWKSMEEDDKGLRVVGELTPDNPTSEKVYASMKHGAVTGLSIGYRTTHFEENDHAGLDLLKVNLREGSVVSTPANEEARVDIVKFDEENPLESWKDTEYFLRDVGLSAKAAKTLISQIKGFTQRDVAELQNELDELRQKMSGIEAAEKAAERLDSLKAHL